MKVLLVYNPKSGNNKFKSKLDFVKKYLNKKGVSKLDIYESRFKGDIKEYLSVHLKNNFYDMLLVSGGDGTLNEVVNSIVHLSDKPKIGYLPSGTTNDVGYMLGMKKGIRRSLKTIFELRSVSMDIGCMNDNYFVYTSGCGKFTNVSYQDSHGWIKRRFGRLYYFLKSAEEIVRIEEMNLTVGFDDKVISGKYFLMLALNGNRVAGYSINKKFASKLNDGKLDLVLFTQKNFTSMLNMTNYFIFGDYYKEGVTVLKSDKFSIKSDKGIYYNLDGECSELVMDVNFSVCKKCIDIYVSKKSFKKYF